VEDGGNHGEPFYKFLILLSVQS